MSFPYTPKLQDVKIESMQTQHEYLKLLRLRHLQWTNTAENTRIGSGHLEIANLIEQITDRYDHLFSAMQNSDMG